MEHTVTLKFNLNDEALAKKLEEDAYNDIIANLEKDFKNAMPKIDSWKITYKEDQIDWSGFARQAVKDIVDEHEEEIIQLAAKNLCKAFQRTKAFKETMIDNLNKLLEED